MCPGRGAYDSSVTTPQPPGQPTWRTERPAVDPEQASIIVRIRQPSFAPIWETADIQINGHDVLAHWQYGAIAIGVPPGHYRLRAWKPRPRSNRRGLLGPRSAAELSIALAPRQTVELEYAPSLWFGIDGSLGPSPQALRGVAPAAIAASLWAILCLTLLVLVALQS
jgi:hypothetical protein